jgi:hypothetical protein
MNIWFIPGMIAGGGTMLAAVFWIIGFIMRRRTAGWSKTEGQVIADRRHLQHFADRKPVFVFQTPSGREYVIESIVRQSPAPSPGTRVEVLYDPIDPSRAIINSFVQSGSLFTLTGYILFIFFLLGAGLALFILSLIG